MQSSTCKGIRTVAIGGLLVGACSTFGDEGPLRVRNLAPGTQLFGLPRALGGDVLSQGTELTFSTELANNFVSDAERQTLAFFDGETAIFTYGLRRPFGERFEYGVSIPYLIHHGGFLDTVIDNFHDAFGFDGNGREHTGRGHIDYFVADDGEVFADFQNQRRDWGDVRLSGGYQLLRNDSRSLAGRIEVKLPTGDVDDLTGSEGTDVAFWADYTDRSLLSGIGVDLTTMLGIVWLGDGELAPDKQEDYGVFAHLGLSYQISERWALKVQFDAHSELMDTHVDQVGGEALMGTLGARWHVTPTLWTDLAIIEDVYSDSTSDVVLQVAFGARI
jgi:hypothetical protein